MEPVETICHHRAAKNTRERLSSPGVRGLLRVWDGWVERISGRRGFWPAKSSSLVHEPQPRSACTEGVWCRRLTREGCRPAITRRCRANARVAAAARWTRRAAARGRSRAVEESSAGVVRGGGADQCLDGSQYHKNSERVGRCWWSSCTGAVMGMAAVMLLLARLVGWLESSSRTATLALARLA